MCTYMIQRTVNENAEITNKEKREFVSHAVVRFECTNIKENSEGNRKYMQRHLHIVIG